MKSILLLGFFTVQLLIANGQIFTKNEDETDDLVAAGNAPENAYSGCAWIDYDNDGNLDLFWVRSGLYHNNGAGKFELITNSHMRTDAGFGTTWADFNNDGFIDGLVTGGNSRGSSLHMNNGDGTFSKITTTVLNDSLALRGWGAAFGDFDNNAFVDFIIAAPFGFAGVTDGNKLLVNNADGTFYRLDTSIICQGTAPYTIPTWSDYDNDGDMDCFIGSGPANGTVAKDYLFKNQLKETGIPNYFTKITTAPIGTDLLDGQIWNWIDYDNDGDLDAYVTNYVGTSGGIGMPNNLYRNDDGLFVKMTAAEVGPIVSDNGASLASVWEDFDNDGDLDCFVTNDGVATCKYYENNNGVFTDINSEPVTDITAAFYGAAAGDYDKDGDVDLFVVGTAGGKALYNNNSSTNGNNWMQIKLTGIGSLILNGSNRSAIGAIVRVKAIIDGNVVWQMREISAQNSFNSMSSLDAEFGLGDASIIDSIIISWPSGIVDSCAALPVNQFYTITEGNCPEAVKINQPEIVVAQNLIILPNPAQDIIQVDLNVIHASNGVIRVTDTAGKIVLEQHTGNLTSGQQSLFVKVNLLPQGIYTCSIILDGQTISATFTKY